MGGVSSEGFRSARLSALGREFHFTSGARKACEHERLGAKLYLNLNGQGLARARQLRRVRRLQVEAFELASGRRVRGGVNRVAAPFDEERKQSAVVVPQMEQSPAQNFAVRTRAL